MIVIKVAEIPIAIDNKYRYIEELARDYITDDEPVFSICAGDEEILEEGRNSDAEFSNAYLESIVVYRKIAEKLPMYDAFVFHGAILSYHGGAYAFTAQSGVGKTTHTRLWMSEFKGEADYINGDKPIIRFISGNPTAFGTPWRGKEGYGKNTSAVLKSIALIERGAENEAFIPEAGAISVGIIKQIYMPKDSAAARRTMQLASKMIASVRLIGLRCNMQPEAAHVAMSAMVKEKNQT